MVASAVAIDEAKSNVRLAWAKVHRYAGLFIAFFLIIAGITGTALAFYKELDGWLNPQLFNVAERAQPALGPDELATKIAAAYPHSTGSTRCTRVSCSASGAACSSLPSAWS